MAHSVVGTSLASVVGLLLLLGCAAAPPRDQASPTSELAPSPSVGPSETTTTNSFDGPNKYFPVRIGNSWVYIIRDGNGESTLTDTMSVVVSDGPDVIATIDRTIHNPDAAYADESISVDFVFHQDGSVTEPLSYLMANTPGTLEWPSTADFEAGTPRTGSFPVGDGKVVFSILGQGNENVTVPLGTFESRRLVQNLLLSGSGLIDVPFAPTYWLSPEVGIVRAEIPDFVFGGASAVIELLSFTRGPAR